MAIEPAAPATPSDSLRLLTRSDEPPPRVERPSAKLTTVVMLTLVIAFLSMHAGGLAAALIAGDTALLSKAFDHLSAASTSVLAVLAALCAPSPLER